MIPKILTTIRNGYIARRGSVSLEKADCHPPLLDILWKENFIRGYRKCQDNPKNIQISLGYSEGTPACTQLVALTRPCNRLYLSCLELSRIPNSLGFVIVSTSTGGLMSAARAVSKGSGGEILAFLS